MLGKCDSMEHNDKVFYYDKNNNLCDREDACYVHIHEYDETGIFLQETIGYINRDDEGENV